MRGHSDLVNSARFSPDGTRIITASQDETARIWDAATGKEIFAYLVACRDVLFADFSRDGKRVVTVARNPSVFVWDSSLAFMPVRDLLTDVGTRRLRGRTRLSRDEMRLAGYPDSEPEIDVGAGLA